VPAISYPARYRPHGPQEFAAFHAECAELLDQATALDTAQRALAAQLANVRTRLAAMHVVMWPRVDPKDIVQGYRITHRGGPPPIPPVAPDAHPLHGKHLRSGALAVLARNQRPMTLVEIHRELHLNGYAIASRHPVKRLADALAYEPAKDAPNASTAAATPSTNSTPAPAAASPASQCNPQVQALVE
jgi:hypothetical protein